MGKEQQGQSSRRLHSMTQELDQFRDERYEGLRRRGWQSFEEAEVLSHHIPYFSPLENGRAQKIQNS